VRFGAFGMMRNGIAALPRSWRPVADAGGQERTMNMLWTILLILLVLWVLGLIGSVGGAAIHLLLVLAAIVLIAQLLSGRRTV
jgi:hypothetical protein